MTPAAIIYALAGILWGLYCVRLQKACFPHHSRPIDQAACFVLNCLVWPFSMIMAICSKPCTHEKRTEPSTATASRPAERIITHAAPVSPAPLSKSSSIGPNGES